MRKILSAARAPVHPAAVSMGSWRAEADAPEATAFGRVVSGQLHRVYGWGDRVPAGACSGSSKRLRYHRGMMPTTAKLFLILGTLAAALGVVLGAFGAHALRAKLGPDLLTVWNTAVQYQIWHALGLLLIGLTAMHLPESGPLRWAGGLLVLGIVLFSGSLYGLVLAGTRGLGVVTPFGGAAFIAGWLAYAWAVARM